MARSPVSIVATRGRSIDDAVFDGGLSTANHKKGLQKISVSINVGPGKRGAAKSKADPPQKQE
jgi:hypothetical protein